MAEPTSRESRTGPPDGDLPLDVRQRLHDRVPFALPVIAIVPVVIGVVLATTLAPVRVGAAALGAAGWLLALALRAPAGVLVSRLPKQEAPRFMALISGPAEESVRLLLVLFAVSGFDSVLWAGFGWAAVEVLYVLVTGLAVRRLLLDPSAKAAEARRLLLSMGWLQYVQSLVPLLGAVERVGVSLLHIGFTLLLGWNPLLVLVTMPAHSATNLGAVRLMKRGSVLLMETIVVVVGPAAFAFGLLVWPPVSQVPPMLDTLLGTGSGGAFRPSPHLLAALAPLLVLLVALDVYCLIDLARARSMRMAAKLGWAIVIVFVSAPLGALLYLFLGRERRRGRRDARATAAARWAAWHGQPGTGGHGDARHAGARQAPGAAQPMVTTSGLTRDYGGTGLFDVDLVVPSGSVYGLVGPNGAGKTTLLCLLAATRRADRGTVSMRVGRSRIAVCPDVPEFDGWLTAYEVVDLARSLVAPAADGQAVHTALTTAGLADSARRRVGGFSRGMVQRLGLACALVGDPELLVLDEPTSALDPAGRAEVLGLVAAMRGRRTMIFSSHILADVQRIADQVGILRDGRLLYQGATRDLVDTYLRPSWLVRIAGDAAPVAAAMTRQQWATRVEPVGADALRVDATSIKAGEHGIPAVIAACGAGQVSCEPVAADLEAAFLALTGTSPQE